jgi:hypothetical protein
MRRNGRLAEDYARRHGVPKWYDSADGLIRDPDVDAVYIATPAFETFDKTEIMGTIGKICFSSFDTEPVVLTTKQDVTEFAIDNPPHVHQPLTQTIVDELNGVGRSPSTGESGAQTNWVMDQLLARYNKGL